MRTLALALALLFATHAAAKEQQTIPDMFICKIGAHRTSLAVVDFTERTITWRGQTYSDLTRDPARCFLNYRGTRDGVEVDICVSNRGNASMHVGKAQFDCEWISP